MNNTSITEKLKIIKYQNAGNSVIVIAPLVDLDLQTSYKLQEYLLELVKTLLPGEELFIDLSAVSYIASAGVGALSTALVSAIKFKKKFYICNLKPKVRAVFDVLGLMSYFTEKIPHVPAL